MLGKRPVQIYSCFFTILFGARIAFHYLDVVGLFINKLAHSYGKISDKLVH